jgi:GH43 family beta-xylosidase
MMHGSKSLWWVVFFSILFFTCSKKEGNDTTIPPPPGDSTFINPVINGSDPWVIKKDSFYYYTHTLGNRIAVWRTKAMSKVASSSRSEVYTPGAQGSHSANIWAPEIHFLQGKWYVYYTAGAGPDSTQRLWVLENANADPMQGTWEDKGRIYNNDSDFWAIDATVLNYNGDVYLLWSGRPNASVQTQNIYISRMSDPLTLSGPTIMISTPEFSWERYGEVNEAPQVIQDPNGRVHLIYSASGCWTDDYCLGMLTLAVGGDPLNATHWTKHDEPVFVKKPENMAFGPGHNAFFNSPDGTENWIIYHANTNSGEGCGERRNVRMQEFAWKTDGTPDFGVPVTPGSSIEVPAGE